MHAGVGAVTGAIMGGAEGALAGAISSLVSTTVMDVCKPDAKEVAQKAKDSIEQQGLELNQINVEAAIYDQIEPLASISKFLRNISFTYCRPRCICCLTSSFNCC